MKSKRKTVLHFEKWAYFSLFFIMLGVFCYLTVHQAKAVLTPSAAPPEDNLPEYLRIDDTNQTKSGALRLGSDDLSSPFTYQLEVLGQGAQSSNAFVDNVLSVSQSTQTLYVDPVTHDVCIGPCLGDDQAALEVSTGNVLVTGIDEVGTQALSSDAESIVGTTYGPPPLAGIKGVSANPLGYGIWAVSTLSTALEGMTTEDPPAHSSVGAYSTRGIALYGANTSASNLWSGYFSGLAESSEIVSGAKVLPTTQRQSFLGYTDGQMADQYFREYFPQRVVSDGQWLWVGQGGADHTDVLQVDTGTGRVLTRYNLGPTQDMIYDSVHGYIWQAALTYPGQIGRIDLAEGLAESRQVVDTDGHDTCPLGYLIQDPTDADILWVLQPGGVCFGRDYHDRLLKFSIADYDTDPRHWEPVARYEILHDETPDPPYAQGVRSLAYDTTTGSIWIALYDNDAVYQIDAADPGNGDQTIESSEYTRYDVPGPVDLAYDSDRQYLWIASDDNNNANDGAYYIDIGAGTVSDPIGVYSGTLGPQAIIYDGARIWVATSNGLSGSLDMFPADDPATIAHYPTNGAAAYQDVLYDDTIDTVWVPSWYGSSISGITASTGEIDHFFDYGQTDFVVRYHDGTYLWATRDDQLYKIRAADGLTAFAVTVGTDPTDVISDSNAIWVTVAGDDLIRKLDPYTGATSCSLVLEAGDAPSSIVFDGSSYWVTARGTGSVVHVSNTCTELGRIPITSAPDSLDSLMYNGSYLWAVSPADNAVVNINPATEEPVLWTNLAGASPADIVFDNFHYWVANSESNSVTAFFLTNAKVCSQDQTVSCSTDADCAGSGGCFAVPQVQGDYATDTEPTDIVFDGAHIWTANATADSLTRLTAAAPTVRQDISLNFSPQGIISDGSFLWTSGTGISGFAGITSYFTGMGYDQQSLADGLLLQSSGSLTGQVGSYASTGDTRVDDQYRIDGDLDSPENVWGDERDLFVSNGWSQTTAFPEAGSRTDTMLAASDGYMYAGVTYNGHVFRSNDNGQTWEDTGRLPGGNATGLMWVWKLIEDHTGTVWAVTSQDESTPGAGDDQGYASYYTDGVGWTATTAPFANAWIYEIEEYQEGGDWNIYLGIYTRSALYKSNNGGATWTTTSDVPGGDIDSLEVFDGYIYAASKLHNIVSRSNDGGVTWQQIQPVPGVHSVYDLYAASDGYLYAITGSDAASGTGTAPEGYVFRSRDGFTWTQVGDINTVDTTDSDVHTIIEYNDVFFIGTHEIVAGVSHGRIYRSVGGADWTLTQEIAGTSSINSMAITGDGYYYVGTGVPAAVYRNDPLPAGTYTCSEGNFLMDIKKNFLGEIMKLECRSL